MHTYIYGLCQVCDAALKLHGALIAVHVGHLLFVVDVARNALGRVAEGAVEHLRQGKRKVGPF